jgi:hypothetical protein
MVHHRHAGRVVATILEPPEPADDDLNGVPGSNVADDSAHIGLLEVLYDSVSR